MLPSRMVALAALVVVALGPVDAARAQFAGPFAWTISASDTDPFVNSGPHAAGLTTRYLWLSCSGLELAAAEFDIVSTNPPNQILAFTPANGFVNAGSETSLVLSAPCASGSVLAGSLLVLEFVPGSYCLAPSSNSGVLGAWHCPEFVLWDIEWLGLDVGGGSCESQWSNCGHIDCLPPEHCGTCCLGDVCLPGEWPCPAGAVWRPTCGECDPVATVPDSWGGTKSRYR